MEIIYAIFGLPVVIEINEKKTKMTFLLKKHDMDVYEHKITYPSTSMKLMKSILKHYFLMQTTIRRLIIFLFYFISQFNIHIV